MSFGFNQYDTASQGSSFEYLYGGPSSVWETFRQDDIIGTIFEVDFAKNKKIYLNGVEKATLTNTKITDTDGTLCIFVRYGGSAFVTGRVYEFSIYENNTITMNLVPAQHGDDVGMYDTVNNQFYKDAADGNFTAGPEL